MENAYWCVLTVTNCHGSRRYAIYICSYPLLLRQWRSLSSIEGDDLSWPWTLIIRLFGENGYSLSFRIEVQCRIILLGPITKCSYFELIPVCCFAYQSSLAQKTCSINRCLSKSKVRSSIYIVFFMSQCLGICHITKRHVRHSWRTNRQVNWTNSRLKAPRNMCIDSGPWTCIKSIYEQGRYVPLNTANDQRISANFIRCLCSTKILHLCCVFNFQLS